MCWYEAEKWLELCEVIVITDELKIRYSKYYELMLEIGMRGGPRAHSSTTSIRRHLVNQDYVREMKIPLHLSLDPIRITNNFPPYGTPEIFIFSSAGPHEFSVSL